MKKRLLVALALTTAVAGLGAVSAFASTARHTANSDVCVLLPDSKSSVRWETQDRRYLAAAFKAAGISNTIVNAEGDAQKQRSQADQCLTNGAKVILLVNLDSGSGAAIEKAAAAKGAKTIDYDRLTLKGSASYYVSFDNVAVGVLQGKGVVAALTASGAINKKPVIAYLNGAPTDNNATLFKQGYASIIDPLFKSGKAIKGPDSSVQGWDNQKARTIFDQMLVKTSNKIDAVAAANDGLGNAVITALVAKKLSPIPVSGQDATAQGVQNVLAGWQAGTVYKGVKQEADAASALAIALIKGTKAATNGAVNDGVRDVPSVLLTPTWITKANYNVLFTEGFLKKADVCQGDYAKYCK